MGRAALIYLSIDRMDHHCIVRTKRYCMIYRYDDSIVLPVTSSTWYCTSNESVCEYFSLAKMSSFIGDVDGYQYQYRYL